MFLHEHGELALASRLKAASDGLYAVANAVYRASGVDLDARWFPLLRYLQAHGAAGPTEIAAAIGQTHPAVSQLAAKLRAAGWIARRADRADARRGLLELTARAEARLGSLGPLWRAIRRGARAALDRGRGDLLEGLARLEDEVASGRLVQEILVERDRLLAAPVEIVPYRPQWAAHFRRLNLEWLQRYFVVEAVDRAMLDDPQAHVLDRGGAIVFARLDGEFVGTCALLRESPGVYELSKMAVEFGFRGRGIGRRLLEAAIAEYRRRRGRSLFLESSKRLKPALALYESAGFRHRPAPRPGSHYGRADVYMVHEADATPLPARRKRSA